jgi:hypothetical protein
MPPKGPIMATTHNELMNSQASMFSLWSIRRSRQRNVTKKF